MEKGLCVIVGREGIIEGGDGSEGMARARASAQGLAFLLALVLLPIVAPSAAAQLPHAYPGGSMYMEGYFLPPVTASPSDPDWTADGQALSFSYQGYIWTVPVGGGIAQQTTDGPGYHSQPAWSPDGRYLAYTADIDRNLDIWVLDTELGVTRRLTSHSHIDVLPRWSPDGSRLLFTSNRGGTFDLWVIFASGGDPTPITREAEINNLAGDWLDGGGRVVFISDRDGAGDAPMGSGSLWTADSDGGASQVLKFEETTYHTMPVAQPGGSDVAYVSHVFGNNEIVTLPKRGGEAYRVTRTPWSELFPAWSPDGETLAFISNRYGDFELQTVYRHGGNLEPVPVRRYDWKVPTARLEVEVVDTNGRPIPARVYLIDAAGRAYFPQGSFPSVSSITEEYFFQSDGQFGIEVPAGTFSVRAQRGFEFVPASATVEVTPRGTARVTLRLERLADMAAAGWYSGDNHTHSNYAGHYRVTPEEMIHRMRAEDLSVVNDLLANKHSRLLNLEHFTGAPDPVSTPDRILYFAQEFRPSFEGHMNLLALDRLIYPFMLGYRETPLHEDYPTNADVLRELHQQGGVGGYVHPYYVGDGPPEQNDYEGATTLPVTAALGLVDFIELACVWSDELTTSGVWYRLLNTGLRIPASAGSDAMPNMWRRPTIGATRVYVKLDGSDLSYRNWIDGLVAGRSFVTSGPLLSFTVDGRGIGDELAVRRGETVHVKASAQSIFQMDSLQVIHNGRVVATTLPDATGRRADLELDVIVDASGWLAVRALGPKQSGVMDTNLFAHSSPVYVVVDGEPITSSADAAYFLTWIDRLEEMVRANLDGYSEAAREQTLRDYADARRWFTNQLDNLSSTRDEKN